MPALEQRNLGLETQKQFAEYYNVSQDTLTDWKRRGDFEEKVDAILKMWSIGKTPDVVHGIYRAAVKGNPMSQLLWLQYFKKFVPKQEIEHTKKVEIGVHDIRFIIEQLPEPQRSICYGYLRDIIDTANSLRDAGQLPDRDAPDATLEGVVSGEADHDAYPLPEQERDAMAARNQRSVRENVEREIFPRDYQGTARWW